MGIVLGCETFCQSEWYKSRTSLPDDTFDWGLPPAGCINAQNKPVPSKWSHSFFWLWIKNLFIKGREFKATLTILLAWNYYAPKTFYLTLYISKQQWIEFERNLTLFLFVMWVSKHLREIWSPIHKETSTPFFNRHLWILKKSESNC